MIFGFRVQGLGFRFRIKGLNLISPLHRGVELSSEDLDGLDLAHSIRQLDFWFRIWGLGVDFGGATVPRLLFLGLSRDSWLRVSPIPSDFWFRVWGLHRV